MPSIIADLQPRVMVLAVLALLVLAWVVLAIKVPGIFSRVSRVCSDWFGGVVVATGLAIIGLGMWHHLGNEQVSWANLVDAAYKTIQLFTLNADVEAAPDREWVALSLAEGLAAMFAVMVAFQAILALFRQSLTNARIACARSHVVICGAGRTGRRIIEDLHRRREHRLVVAIDVDAQHPEMSQLHELGALTLIGDATKPEVLRKAGLARAREAFIVTGSDEQNVQCALRIEEMLPRRRRRVGAFMRDPVSQALTCHVHVVNRDLAGIFRERADELEQQREGLDIEVFSAVEATARKLLESMVTELPLPDRDEVAHFVLFGFDAFGQAIALQLAELAHFANNKRLRMTIADSDIRAKATAFLARYPRFCAARNFFDEGENPFGFDSKMDAWESRGGEQAATQTVGSKAIEFVCNASFVELKDVCDEAFIGRLSAALAGDGIWPAVILCFNDERENFASAERLRELRNRLCEDPQRLWPLFAWIPERRELADLLNRASADSQTMTSAGRRGSGLVRAFGACDENSLYADIADAWPDRLARFLQLVYENEGFREYVHAIANASSAPVESDRRWDMFEERARSAWQSTSVKAIKPSTRSAALHAIIKLASVGWCIDQRERGQQCFDLKVDEVQQAMLARMEHYRWVAERLLSGWTWGERDNRRKKRDTIVPFEDLDARNKQMDLDSVLTVVAMCREGRVGVARRRAAETNANSFKSGFGSGR